jgi:hypothetical protein
MEESMIHKNIVPKEQKQRVKFRDVHYDPDYWGSGCKILWGIPENHPKYWLNGEHIHTSELVNVEGDEAETLNTVYEIQNWLVKPPEDTVY